MKYIIKMFKSEWRSLHHTEQDEVKVGLEVIVILAIILILTIII